VPKERGLGSQVEAFVDAGLDLGAAIGLWMSEWWLFFSFLLLYP
jgi:hypothetical protein